MTGRLEGKVALVTGCGSVGAGWGNGKAISALFAKEGANVFGCDADLAAMEEARREVATYGEFAVVQCDVSVAAEVEAAVRTCVERFGRLDILVNNVGINVPGGPVELSHADWQRVFDVNVTSFFLTCKFAIPHMLASGGSIVNIGSVVGIRSAGTQDLSYSVSKAAIMGLSRSIAMQYAKQGIRSNVIMPGLMDTPRVAQRVSGPNRDAEIAAVIEARNSRCPTGQMGDAWDVARAALFLASDEANYITATELIVDGGLSAK